MDYTIEQAREIAKMTKTRKELNRTTSPSREVYVTVVINVKDYGITSPTPLVFVILNETNPTAGYIYPVGSIEEGEDTGFEALEHLNESFECEM